MKIRDYCEELWDNGFYDEMIDEAYWQQSFSSHKMFNATLAEASRNGIELVGINTFDYDTYFTDGYNATEKGLS